MEANFWHERWQKKEIAFHASQPHAFLTRYFASLKVPPGGRVFVPLCGKTLDIGWLLAQGYSVAGAELSEIAIQELFAELKKEPTVTAIGALKHYHSTGIDIFVGDIFALTRAALGKVDAVYDRAALVALPKEMRDRYTAHLMALTERAPQLLICFEYDQAQMSGPPFAITPDEVMEHYGTTYQIEKIMRANVPGGLRGNVAHETVWHLSRRDGHNHV